MKIGGILKNRKMMVGIVVGFLFVLPIISETASATIYQNYTSCNTSSTLGWSGEKGDSTTQTDATFNKVTGSASMSIHLVSEANFAVHYWEQIMVTGNTFTASRTSYTITYCWYIDASGDIQTNAGTGGYVEVQIMGRLLNNLGQTVGSTHSTTSWILNSPSDGSYKYDRTYAYYYLDYTYSGLTIGNTYTFCTGLYGEAYLPANGSSHVAELSVSPSTYLWYESN